MEHTRLVQLVFPVQAKRPVVISAAVVTLSAIAHSAIFWLPMPQAQTEDALLTAPATEDGDDISVVMLPESAMSSSPAAVTPETTPSPPETVVSPADPKPATLLPTDVIAAPVAPPPSVADLPPQPLDPNSIEELPVANGDRTPAFASPENEEPSPSFEDQFPHIPGATSCGSGCHQVNGSRHVVATDLLKNLEKEGYTVQNLELYDQISVFKLTLPGDEAAQQFLHVLSGTESDLAIYVISSDRMTPDQLKSLAAQATARHQAV